MESSKISIAYAYDEKSKGGSEKNGVSWYTPFLKKKLISLFEIKFIDRPDKVVGKKHKDYDPYSDE